MKVVLTHGYFLNEDKREQEIMRPYPTLGILYISAFLKQNGIKVSVIDSTFIDKQNWYSELELEKPTLIAFYGNLVTKLNVLELVKNVKKLYPSVTTVIGGPDVTYNLENYLRSGFDIAVIGEGEQTMIELCNAIEKKEELVNVEGIAYYMKGFLIKNKERTKIKEMKALPFPDRKAIPIDKYLSVWETHHGKRTLNISTQRGCPYTCKWCSTAVFGQSYRRNTPERVVEEIFSLKKEFNVEALWFVDDVFTVSHKWLAQLHQEFQRNNLSIPFEIITRAERLNDVVLSQLKEMGCFRIWIGAESGSQKIIDRMDRRVNLEFVEKMIHKTQKIGIEAGTFIMVGYPDELHEDILATYEYIQKCNPTILTITKAYPIKGTDLYREMEQKFTQKLDWSQSTDRDIKFKLPYSDKYYDYAIRFIINGWKAKQNKSFKFELKSKLSKLLMNLMK